MALEPSDLVREEEISSCKITLSIHFILMIIICQTLLYLEEENKFSADKVSYHTFSQGFIHSKNLQAITLLSTFKKVVKTSTTRAEPKVQTQVSKLQFYKPFHTSDTRSSKTALSRMLLRDTTKILLHLSKP